MDEYPGYVGDKGSPKPVLRVTAITHVRIRFCHSGRQVRRSTRTIRTGDCLMPRRFCTPCALWVTRSKWRGWFLRVPATGS